MYKIENLIAKVLLTVMLILMLGCSATSENGVQVSTETLPVYKEPVIDGKKVLAQLEKTDDGYRFTSFSLFPENYTRALQVSLNSGRHINGDNKTIEECVSGIMAHNPDSYSTLRGCKTENQARFRQHSASEKMVKNIMMGVMTAGLMTATARDGVVRFNTEAYDQAYKEARMNFRYGSLKGRAAVEKLIQDVDQKFLSHQKASKEIKRQYLDRVESFEFAEEVRNLSGFGNVNFEGFAKVRPLKIEIWDGRGSSSTTPDDFVASIDVSFTEYRNKADSLAKKALVYCNNTQPDFNVEFSCPSQINLTAENTIFSSTVISRNVKDYLPLLTFSDNNLSVELNDNKMTVINKSSKFISVEEVSLYKDAQIIKVPLSNSLRLSPNEKGEFLVKHSIINNLYTNLKEQTKQQLNNTNVEYAVALRYQVSTGSSSTQDLTFYRNQLVNIGESI